MAFQARKISQRIEDIDLWLRTIDLRNLCNAQHPRIFRVSEEVLLVVCTKKAAYGRTGDGGRTEIAPQSKEEQSPAPLGNSVPSCIQKKISEIVSQSCAFPREAMRNVTLMRIPDTWNIFNHKGNRAGVSDYCEEVSIQFVSFRTVFLSLTMFFPIQQAALFGATYTGKALAGRTSDDDIGAYGQLRKKLFRG